MRRPPVLPALSRLFSSFLLPVASYAAAPPRLPRRDSRRPPAGSRAISRSTLRTRRATSRRRRTSWRRSSPGRGSPRGGWSAPRGGPTWGAPVVAFERRQGGSSCSITWTWSPRAGLDRAAVSPGRSRAGGCGGAGRSTTRAWGGPARRSRRPEAPRRAVRARRHLPRRGGRGERGRGRDRLAHGAPPPSSFSGSRG